jgi:microcompartment protein CcmK/EutM
MIMARTVGTVTLSRFHPSMAGATLRCVEVVTKIEDINKQPLGGETVIAWDICGTSLGDLVAMAEGPEAGQPFAPNTKPIDASIVAISDNVRLN